MTAEDKLKNYNWLYDQYVIQNKSIVQISKEFNINRAKVSDAIHKFDLHKIHEIKLNDKNWLYDQYVNQRKSTVTISKELNVSARTVGKAISKFNIIRPYELKLKDYDWMYEQYITKQRTLENIASELGILDFTVGKAIKDLGIPTRTGRHKDYDKLTNYEWMTTEYTIKHRTLADIAAQFKVAPATISESLKNLGIEVRRTNGEYYHPELNDYNWLYQRYIVEEKPLNAIADELNVVQSTVADALHKLNIPIRACGRQAIWMNLPYYNYDWLYNEYIINHKSITEIAKKAGVSDDTIYRALIMNNIDYWTIYKRRGPLSNQEINEIIDKYVNQYMSANQISKEYNTDNNTIINIIKNNGIEPRNFAKAQYVYFHNKEAPVGFNNYDYLYQRYVVNHEMTKDIAADLNISPTTVIDQLHRFGIPVRHEDNTPKFIFDREDPACKLSLYDLGRSYFYNNIRPLILARDNYTCVRCGYSGPGMEVHHNIISYNALINQFLYEHPYLDPNDPYDKAELYRLLIQDYRFNDLNNVVTLCANCHHTLPVGQNALSPYWDGITPREMIKFVNSGG